MLASDIAGLLPPEIPADRVTHAARLSRGLDDQLGETLLLVCDGTLRVLCRPGFTTPFAPLALGEAPRLEQGEWSSTLHLTGADGAKHTLEVTSFDLDQVTAVLEAVGDTPTEPEPEPPESEPEPPEPEHLEPSEPEPPEPEPPEPPELETEAPETAAPTQPLTPDALRERLRELLEAGKQDAAWCLAAALVALDQADEAEQRLYDQHRDIRQPAARLTDAVLARLRHPDEDPVISGVMAAVGPLLSRMTARPHKQFGLQRSQRRDLNTDVLLLSRSLGLAVAVLDVVQPELYVRPDQPVELMLAHTVEVASFVAGGAVLQGRSEQELLFICARQLLYLRPEYFLARVLPEPAHLRTALHAALLVGDPRLDLPGREADDTRRLVDTLTTRLASSQLVRLEQLAGELASGATPDLERWLHAVELTTQRVGLLLCGDLPTAVQCVRQAAGNNLEARIEDLLRFGTSPAFFAARRALGLGIDGPDTAAGPPPRAIDSPVPLAGPGIAMWLGLGAMALVLVLVLALVMC